MFRIRRKISILLCLVLLVSVVGVTGCSNEDMTESSGEEKTATETKETEKSQDVKETEEKEPKVVTMWWRNDQGSKERIQKVIDDFEAENPDVTIEVDFVGDPDNYDKLKVALAGHTAPDIVKIDHVYTQALGYKGQFLDLVPLGANDIKDKFIESCWNAGTYQDKVYGLPFDANTIAFFYNKDIFDEAGAKVPTTYDEIIDAAEKIKAIGGDEIVPYTVPFTEGTSGWVQFQWLFWLWRSGGDVLNEDWTEAIYNSPEGVEALQLMLDLQEVHEIIPKNSYYEGEFFDAGKVGMIDMGCWLIQKAIDEEEGKDLAYDLDVVTMPSLKEGVPNYSGLGQYSIGITSLCENPQEAFDFLSFYTTNTEYQLAYTTGHRLIPSLKEALNDEYYQRPEWKVFTDQLKVTKSRPGTPAWPEIAEHMAVAIQQTLTGMKSPQEALDDAVAKSNEAIKAIK